MTTATLGVARPALAGACGPGHAHGWTVLQSVEDAPGDDPIARIKEVAKINEEIREGLAAAGRDEPGD